MEKTGFLKRIEPKVGNIIAAILIAIVIIANLYYLFSLFFRGGRGIGLYGSRGEFYMAE